MDTNSTNEMPAVEPVVEPKIVKPEPINLESTVREHVKSVAAQATAKARETTTQGLNTAGEVLENVAATVEDSAQKLDERFGKTYGDFARKAADTVSGAANTVRGTDVDDLLKTARDTVRKRPWVVAGVAAAVGFALTRLFRVGEDEHLDG